MRITRRRKYLRPFPDPNATWPIFELYGAVRTTKQTQTTLRVGAKNSKQTKNQHPQPSLITRTKRTLWKYRFYAT